MEAAEHWIQDLSDGIIGEKEFDLLMELMRKDAAVRELYLDHMNTVALLKLSADSRVKMGTMPVNSEMIYRQRKRSAIASFSYGLAALVILSLVFYSYNVNQRQVEWREFIVMDGSVDANYSVVNSEADFRDVKSLQVGDKVILNQGLVRLTFPSGVEAIVEGPSELELISDLSLRMNQGQAWFRVPEEGHGFTVDTDRVRVIDLGTEFGVWLDGSQNLQVHVAKGKVRVEPHLKAMRIIEILQDQAMSFDVYGQGQEIEAKLSMFRQKFTESMPYLHWSFDELVDGHFSADGTIPKASEFSAQLRQVKNKTGKLDILKHQTSGRFKRALSMHGEGVYAQTKFPGIGGNTPRTLAMWVKHRNDGVFDGLVSPYCIWGRRGRNALWKISIRNDGDARRFYTVSLGAEYVSELSNDNLAEWMHLASVYTGRSLEDGVPEVIHYVNGVRQLVECKHSGGGGLYIDTDVLTDQACPVRFGASIVGHPKARSVDGDLDEVYLFRGVLNESQIKQLMQTNHLDFFVK